VIRTSLTLAIALALTACGGDDDGCEGGAGCGEPCAPGNDFGVGMYCTPGGGECGDTPDRLAPFCTVDFDDTAPAFCTRPCEPGDDLAMCGEDAVCTGQGGDTGCVPVACTD
jgi:hypothetical protein